MGLWTNSDGLRVKLGTTEAEVIRGGELNTAGSDRQIEFVVDLSSLAASSTLLNDTDNIIFPTGWVTTEVVLFNETAADSAGDTATLTLGLKKATDYSTALDADGFTAAVAQSTVDVAGETNVIRIGSSGVGSSLGVALSEPGVLAGNYGTEAFTAGRLRVTVKGYIKRPSPTN
jgi:hypothetical protein